MSIDTGGPFDDPIFSAIARRHGCRDRGSHWHLINLDPMHTEGSDDWGRAGPRGFDNDVVLGAPSDMPRFRFARDEEGASLMVDGERYVYSVRKGVRQIAIQDASLPDTLLLAAPGRRLSEYIDVPGADGETIAEAREGARIGNVCSIILILA